MVCLLYSKQGFKSSLVCLSLCVSVCGVCVCVCVQMKGTGILCLPPIGKKNPSSAALKLLIDVTLLTASIAFKKNIHHPVFSPPQMLFDF